MDKNTLRGSLKRQAAALSDDYRKKASAAIAKALCETPAFAAAQTVFVYLSTEYEPDTAGILRAAFAAKKRVAAPRCGPPPEMEAALLAPGAPTVPGRLGLREPTGPAVPPEEIDLAIVPCVAATADGRRLGHGGGYYDAYLARCPAKRVCLCFARLLADDLPADPWDARMDLVLSETANS